MIREYYIYFSQWFDPFFLIYFAIINLFYAVFLVLGSIGTYQRLKERRVEDLTSILQSNSLPEISLIVAAYNESKNILSNIDNLINLSYRYKKIIFVNDGSTDNTVELIRERLQLIPIPRYYSERIPTQDVRGIYRSQSNPEIICIDKENGTKFDALNAGLNACQTPYFITTDADTYLSDEYFQALIRPMLISPEVIATGASVRIRNGYSFHFNRISTDHLYMKFLPAMQSLEYLRAFLMRQGWNYINEAFLLSGAFSVFKTKIVLKAGGFAPTLGEDFEIILRLNCLMRGTKTPYKIVYIPDPIAWTEAAQPLKRLARQRSHWQRGALEALWFNKRAFFNPKYGKFGFLVYPFFVLGEALEPLVEIAGYIYILIGLWLGAISLNYILLFLLITWGFISLFSQFCLLVEELSYKKFPSLKNISSLFLYSILENFGYHQLSLWWRIKGFVSFFKKFNSIQKDCKMFNERVTKILHDREFKW